MHALLIGIDNYEGKPLSGCVNDIDCAQGFLIDKLDVLPACITRLEAPLPSAGKDSIPAQRLPTFDNVVTALRMLASEAVVAGEPVFIYYSGHGSYEWIPGAESYFEGLVPLDYREQGLLYDVELNALLQSIARRSGDLTVILDCCHSAGVTRDITRPELGMRARFLPSELQPRGAARVVAAQQTDWLKTASASANAPQDYTVAAACHADEVASECRVPPTVGKTRGLFSYSLFQLLEQHEKERLATLRWSDIWEQLKSRVSELQPTQRPMLLGPRQRRLFGGPWRPQDLGYAVQRRADGGYTIAAGSLAGLGPGALVAVYGPQPDLFPPLDTPEDEAVRLGVLAVQQVQPAQATACPAPQGAASFGLPSAARGRLIKPGDPEILRVAVGPELDPKIRQLLGYSSGPPRFALLPGDDPRAECRIGQYENGDVWIGDDLFGPGPPLDSSAPGPMGRVRYAETADADERAFCVRSALNHYAQYVIPLRLYRSGGFTLSEQAVSVRLLDCQSVADPRLLERDASRRREARRDDASRRYLLAEQAQVAIQVHNTLNLNLYVFLLLCSLEGQVQFLVDNEALINARSSKLFWANGTIGEPFVFACQSGHAWGLDRLIVLATDQKGVDLAPLQQAATMDEIIATTAIRKAPLGRPKPAAGLRWTALQTLIQVGGPPSGTLLKKS